MTFNTALFVCFFAIFFLVFNLVARTRLQKLWAVTIASALFYAGWDARFVPLLFGTALLDFYIALAIDRSDDDRRRKRLLVSSIVLNLSVLGVFKYTNFAIASAYGLLGLFGVQATAPVLDIVLPIGISFYTFQSMSYTIDVHRRQLRARERPIEFLAGVSFFPHLVAGPIIRASTLLPQFETMTPPTWMMTQRGFLLVAAGVFKKSVADLVGRVADQAFAGAPTSALEAWTGALAFAAQIYGDFSGYTDIAIGVALLLGFVVPRNFDLPYFATSPLDYWQRWHISFSSWLRDYVYTPLALKNRRHPYSNIVITMFLSGLWHGAGATFVVWGLYYGVIMVITQWLSDHLPEKLLWVEDSRLMRAPKIALTFYLTLVGFVLFRAQTFGSAFEMLRSMHAPSATSIWTWSASAKLAAVLFSLVIGHLVSYLIDRPRDAFRPFLLWPSVAVLLFFGVVLGGQEHPFIYFQF